MELKIIKGITGKGNELLEITNNNTKFAIGFGEEIGTGDIAEKDNPGIEGLSFGTPSYDGIFILRNPENCNIINYGLKQIPIYMHHKLKNYYSIYCGFSKRKFNDNIVEIADGVPEVIKDIEVTSFLIDPSNLNTHIIKFKDVNSEKTIVVSGDFKNYDENYDKAKLNSVLDDIGPIDYLVIEGKYLGKYGPEYSSGKQVLDKLKNMMKYYKQTFVIQSETDMIMASNLYEAAKKTKRNFIETSLLCNISTSLNGSSPNPITSKKVYSYNPLILENEEFEFKKKYIIPFYISNAINKMKKEKYVMTINKNMLQDLQLFKKDGSFYDACIIYAQSSECIEKDKDLDNFINELKNYETDYYELYTHGQVNMNVIYKIISKLEPKAIIPLGYENADNSKVDINKFKILKIGEKITI